MHQLRIRSMVDCVLPLLLLLVVAASPGSGLSADFYAATCPNVASIVTQSITQSTSQSNVVPPSLLRIFFHDAMVQRCDASILISTMPGGEPAERDFTDNLTLRQEGFDAVEAAKQAVEAQCPGVVSCADILALATRDAVVLSGGPSWTVLLGRLDGLTSSAAAVRGRLPGADFNVTQLIDNFALVGLSISDMVILSGGHTVGFSHCNQFTDRLYDFDGVSGVTDPILDPSFAQTLEKQCPRTGANPSTIVAFDAITSLTFDNDYYVDLQRGQGLLFSDQVLFNDLRTRDLVNQLASSSGAFFSDFTQAMINLGNVVVNQPGNIRRICSAFNAS